MYFAYGFGFGFILGIGGHIGNLCDFSFMVFILNGELEFSVDIFGAVELVFVVGYFV